MTISAANLYRALFVLALLGIGVLAFARDAASHETMGHWGKYGTSEYLYGHKIGNNLTDGKVNCCLFKNHDTGKQGDCKRYPEEKVKFVPGGYLLADGEFISHAETNVSPQDPHTGEYYFYRCQHDPGGPWGDNPKTHCFFAPPTGS